MSGDSAEASGERAVAAGGDIGSVSTGDFVTQVARATVLPSEALDFSRRVFHLPQRAEQFVGRERELRLLDAAFTGTGGVVVHAVHGLGGIGKSTLAARWAADQAAVYNPVWWITAESPSELQAGLAAFGRALQPALIDVLTDEALRERALQWLSSHDGWLLVLDNVSDPSDIGSLLARAPGGRFLITTRLGAATWRGVTKTLDLDVLELGEAVQLFQRIYDGPADGVEDLCGEVGCLPLALDQAAAYCREAGVTPRRYLDLLALHPAQMFAATAEAGDAQRTVARVWEVTLERLDGTPAVARILRTLAWWAPEAIPRAYLDGLADPVTVTEGIRRLAAYSMITLREDRISVHRLVQAMARAAGREERRRESDFAARTLGEVRLEGHAWDAAAQGWAAHVETLASRVPAEDDTEELASLFVKAALHLAALNPTRSAALCARSTTAIEHLRGADSAEASGLRLLTGLAQSWQGDFKRAHPLFERQLSQATQLYGEDHPTTFLMRCLTISVQARIDPARARARAEETVERVARTLGHDHPLVLRRRAQMSVLLPADVKPDSAGSRLADAVGRLGEDAWELMPLGRAWLTELESDIEFGRAATLVAKMLDRCQSVLGSTDAVTLALRLEQVSVLFYAGAAARARMLVPGLIADWAEYMGDTANTWHLIEYLAPLLDQTNE
ncbi:NB-ARC domain-containing protein [Streptomyces sp. NPDC087263]|uniref:NB-ARC domain-containing protein n=1 Tax=Streptomyces sp. NPDC087263 TaxID=3365773 RepID=UPI003800D50D